MNKRETSSRRIFVLARVVAASVPRRARGEHRRRSRDAQSVGEDVAVAVLCGAVENRSCEKTRCPPSEPLKQARPPCSTVRAWLVIYRHACEQTTRSGEQVPHEPLSTAQQRNRAVAATPRHALDAAGSRLPREPATHGAGRDRTTEGRMQGVVRVDDSETVERRNHPRERSILYSKIHWRVWTPRTSSR